MILCELWDFPQDNTFALVLSITAAVNSGKYLNYQIFPVKYVLGSSHNLLVPLAILLTKPEVWKMAKKVMSNGMEDGRDYYYYYIPGLSDGWHHSGQEI